MTGIVGIETPTGVILGGDSAGCDGWSLTARVEPKVFENGPFVMGFTSSFRMGQLLRYSTIAHPALSDERDLDRFMATKFVDSVRDLLKDGGYTKVENGAETGGLFLVGLAGTLYRVGVDFEVGRAVDGYMAVGCGADLALGAMHATDGAEPRARIETALAAAARHSAGVCGPFHLISQKRGA